MFFRKMADWTAMAHWWKDLESSSSTTKTTISPLPQCPWSLNFAGQWLTMIIMVFVWHVISLDHVIKRSCDFMSCRKVTWPFDHVVLRDHTSNENHYNSTRAMPRTTKFRRVVSTFQGLLPVMLLDLWSLDFVNHENN